jgi:large subunit ribosomal protein L31
VDVCAKCHPFYTGQQRIIDTGGQVERFLKRQRRTEGTEQAASSTAG